MTLFELVASLKLDDSEYVAGLTDSEKKAYTAGTKIGNGLQTLGGGAVTAVKAIGTIGGAALKVGATVVKGVSTAVGATAAAITPIVKQAVSAYGEQQQLVGGIQKLYGNMGLSLNEYAQSAGKSIEEVRDEWQMLENAQNLVAENAKNAFKTTGMSANEYMQNVTGFSAALINSLGGNTEVAAHMADMAMQDIADNANTFGKYSVQELTNVYQALARGQFQTLDNRNLGFGGTKEGMQELLDKAQELSGVEYDIGSFSDIVDAIHVVQDSMNITGTTANEAAGTLQGSFSMVAAAWKNLLAGLGSGEDITPLIDNLINSAEGAFKNLLPTIENALNGIVDLITKLAPVIADKLPALLGDILPSLISAATSLITALAQALPTLIPAILPALIQAVTAIVIAIAQNLPQIIQALIEQLPLVITSIGQALLALAPALFEVGKNLLQTIWNGFSEAMPEASEGIVGFIDTIKEVWNSLVDAFNAVVEYLSPIFEAIGGYLSAFWELVSTIVGLIVDYVKGKMEENSAFIQAAMDYIRIIFETAWNVIKNGVQFALTFIQTIFTTVFGVIQNIVKAFTAILKGDWKGALEFLKSAATTALEGVKRIFTAFKDGLANIFNGIKNSMLTWGRDMIENLIKGIKEKIDKVKEAMNGVGDAIKERIHFSVPDKGPLSDFDTYAPDMMMLFAQGIKDNAKLITDAIGESFNIQPSIESSMAYPIGRGTAAMATPAVTTDRQLQPINVTIGLEGDAERLFRVVKVQAEHNRQITGKVAYTY